MDESCTACGTHPRRCADDVEHPLCRVRSGRIWQPSILLEIVDQDRGTLADFTKVDSLSAFRQEQQAIETLEEHGGRLMNGAENGLSVILQFGQQIQDTPRCL